MPWPESPRDVADSIFITYLDDIDAGLEPERARRLLRNHIANWPQDWAAEVVAILRAKVRAYETRPKVHQDAVPSLPTLDENHRDAELRE